MPEMVPRNNSIKMDRIIEKKSVKKILTKILIRVIPRLFIRIEVVNIGTLQRQGTYSQLTTHD